MYMKVNSNIKNTIFIDNAAYRSEDASLYSKSVLGRNKYVADSTNSSEISISAKHIRESLKAFLIEYPIRK